MAQPQPPRALSPAQGSPSPVSAPSYLQAAKRPRFPSVPPPSQPDSPYATSTFAMSPGAPTPPPAATSPAPQTGHSSPYATGASTPGLSLPQAHPSSSGGAPSPSPTAISPQPPTPTLSTAAAANNNKNNNNNNNNTNNTTTTTTTTTTLATPTPIAATAMSASALAMSLPTPAPATPLSFTNATMAPIMPAPQLTTAYNLAPTATTPGVMGPPLKPPEKPTKELEYDVTDSLAGTGIDVRAEEQYMANLYSFDEARTGFPQYPPSGQRSFYGAGPTNQPAQSAADASQAEVEALAARRAWEDSAARLAASRASELTNPFLNIAQIHSRAERLAKEYGLELNMDPKAANPIGRMRAVNDFPQPTIKVTTRVGPDAAIIHTYGSWLPHDAYLADQVALLSLASKQRLRTLLGDAHAIAKNRQLTSHGEVPEDWQIAAAPLKRAEEADGAENPTGTKSLKRPAKTPHSSEAPAKVTKVAKVSTPSLATMLRDLAREERDQEEARLRKRAARRAAAGTGEPSASQSRAGSVAPSTPGSTAPDVDKPDKPMAKKDKRQSLKTSEAASHASQNLTSKMFTGFSGAGGLFGKKSKGKTYDWMNSASAGAGGGSFGSKGGNAGGAAGSNAPGSSASASNALTAEGRNRMGAWREDREKGKNIQMRDWVYALEQDGSEPNMLQLCYSKLD